MAKEILRILPTERSSTMLVFKHVPNVLKNEGRVVKELPFINNKTIQDYLTETGFELSESRVIVTGAVVKDLTTTLKDGDEIIITPNVEFAAIAAWWAAATFWQGVALVLSVVSVAYSIYSVFNQPRAPSFGTIGQGLDEGSPSYGWDGIVNTQDVGTPIPILYGAHRVGGNRKIKL